MTPEQIRIITNAICAIKCQLYSDWYSANTMLSFEEWCKSNRLRDSMKELKGMLNSEYDVEMV